ncbi:MAG: sugar-binding domain-containing protein, partial [Eubacteriales bacterium]
MKLSSKYTKDVDAMPLAEYPRPQLRRDSYQCLNGTWQYAILPEFKRLTEYQGDILVPFSPETQLSGVEKQVTEHDALYYKKEFCVERSFFKDVTFLHFTAVDYYCEVSLNGQDLGSHKGGFLPFTFDVSTALHEGKNVLTLKVLDPTDTSYIARGKQVSKPGNIWYPGQSGIWGTVWLESVTKGYVKDLRIVPDIDAEQVEITVTSDSPTVSVEVLEDGRVIREAKGKTNAPLTIPMPDAKLWAPEHPDLYDLRITAINSNGLIADSVTSYFGMRKFSVGKDKDGISRLWLNNEP